jgi:DNA topoisomerase I
MYICIFGDIRKAIQARYTEKPAKQSGRLSFGPHPTMPHLPNANQSQIDEIKSRGVSRVPALNSAWGIQIHPDKTNARAATWYDRTGKQQSAYLNSHTEEAESAKHASLVNFQKKIPLLRHKVAKDLDRVRDSDDKQHAAVVRLMDLTAMRVGGREGADRGTYGASTLKSKHIEVHPNGRIHLSFPGKDSRVHHIPVRDTKLAPYLQSRKSIDPEEDLFPRITDSSVRKYLSPFGVNPHRFRTYHATRIAARHLRQTPWTDNPREQKAHVKNAMVEASTMLGNEPKQAQDSYVDKQIVEDYHKGRLHKSFPSVSPFRIVR